MGREEVWKTLADLITEFRKKKETVPPELMVDLQSAKTLIQVLKADPSCVSCVPIIDDYLRNIESHLIIMACKIGSEFTDKWMDKLNEARKIAAEEKRTELASRFVVGSPKGANWLRIQISKNTPEHEIKKLAEDLGLSCKEQNDGYILVHGENGKLKLFVKKTAEKLRGVEAS